MKKISVILPLLLIIVFATVGCGNSGTESTTTSDTMVTKDTINRNSENFSAPH